MLELTTITFITTLFLIAAFIYIEITDKGDDE